MPTTARSCPAVRARKTFAPEPAKSHNENRLAGPIAVAGGAHHVTLSGWLPQASCHASAPDPRNDQRGSPVRRSNAITELNRASAGRHASLQPPGAAARQAATAAGCV